MTVVDADSRCDPQRRSARDLRFAEAVVIPVGALVASALLFSVFLLLLGKSPLDLLQPGLDRRLRLRLLDPEHAAARRAADPHRPRLRHSRPHRPDHDRRRGRAGARRLRRGGDRHPAGDRRRAARSSTLPIMAIAGMLVGGIWVGLAGWLRHYRGVNETISSLLLTYIAIAIMNFFVEGALRDPASANKPSTMPIGDAYRVGAIPGTDVHWGLAAGIVLAIVLCSPDDAAPPSASPRA